jgi:hypothetical protein
VSLTSLVPFLPERHYLRTKVIRTATASERPTSGATPRAFSGLRSFDASSPLRAAHWHLIRGRSRKLFRRSVWLSLFRANRGLGDENLQFAASAHNRMSSRVDVAHHPSATTTVHSAKPTIRRKSVGTRWSACVIRIHGPALGIDRSQNHAHFNPDICSSGDVGRS